MVSQAIDSLELGKDMHECFIIMTCTVKVQDLFETYVNQKNPSTPYFERTFTFSRNALLRSFFWVFTFQPEFPDKCHFGCPLHLNDPMHHLLIVLSFL